MTRDSATVSVATVVSVKSGEFKADATKYIEVKNLTGDQSRAAEVKDVAFPPFPELTDDLPPATVITRVVRAKEKLTVMGTSTDNGTIKSVVVNGKLAAIAPSSRGEWTIALAGIPAGVFTIEARAEDAAGNLEKTPAVVIVK